MELCFDETQLALRISESEARELRRALRDMSGILMAMPFAFAVFWFLIHRELTRKPQEADVAVAEEGAEEEPAVLSLEGDVPEPVMAPLAAKAICDLDVDKAS